MLMTVFTFSCNQLQGNNPTDTSASDHKHIAANGVRENEVAPTCENSGNYDEVIYCAGCHEELSRTVTIINKLPHSYKNGICIHCKEPKPSEGLQFKSNGNGTCSLSGIGNCKDTNIIVPSVSPNGDRVTAISDSALYHCTALDSIRIPASVTSIGNDAFAYCSNLKTVVLSDNITSWGAHVFAGCTGMQFKKQNGLSYVGSAQNPYLVLVQADDKTKTEYEVNANTVFIANDAFNNCSKATDIVIGERVVGIGSSAFQGCSALVRIALPQNLAEINENLFAWCNALETVNIPHGVTVIKNNAFAYCKSLKNITLPEGLQRIEASAFYFCSELTEIAIPNSVTELKGDVFKDCSALASVTLPSGLTEIPGGLFKNCSRLKNVTIPGGVTEIGSHAFENCLSLEEIMIPAAVRTIQDNAFMNCSNLKRIRFEMTDGWQCFDVNTIMIEALDLTNEEQNAAYLHFRYNQYTWKRK